MSDKQIQRAGDYSHQTQIENLNYSSGITEQRAREIYSEMYDMQRCDYTQESFDLACKRVIRLEELLMIKLDKVDGLLEAFGDPSFQFLLRSAQKTAACSDREVDYEMLSELLVHRIEKKEDRKTKASISKAVEIVDQIDDDALCALTIIYAINSWGAISGNISQGLSVMNDLFESLCYRALPEKFDWAYHLDILNAVRVSSVGTYKKISDYYPDHFSGYTCIGIKKETESHQKAIDIFNSANLSLDFLVEHELNDGYVRLRLRNIKKLDDLEIRTGSDIRKPTQNELDAINKVIALYSNDNKIKESVKKAFMSKWDSYDALKTIRSWWDALPNSMIITPVGKVLAHANAQRRCPSVPKINLD